MTKIYHSIRAMLVVFLSLMISQTAYAELLITPTRVLIKDNERFALVTLVNTSNSLKTYEIGFRYFKMREEGGLYDGVEKSVTDFDLGKSLMFSPKRISLTPGASQKIRLSLRRPAEPIPLGDYRVHLTFSSIPNDPKAEAAMQPKRESLSQDRKIGAEVKIYVGFTIPVVLRVGESNAKATIGQVSLSTNEKGNMQVNVPFNRDEGPYSVIGHLFIFHLKPDGTEEKVGEMSNAHIFPEVKRRVFNVALTKNVHSGSLKVVLRSGERGVDTILAEKTFPIQQ